MRIVPAWAEGTVKDLSGSAAKRMSDLAAIGDASNEWLRMQLQIALQELMEIQPIADVERERLENF